MELKTPIESFLTSFLSLCPELTVPELNYIKSDLSISEIKAKHFYMHAGMIQKEIAFVHSGLMRSFFIDTKGNEITVNFMRENSYATHYSAFLTQSASQYYFQCIEPTIIVNLGYEHIQNGYKKFPGIERYGRLIAEEVLKFQQKRIESFLFSTAEERYLEFINTYPDLFNRVSLSHLSTYLGIERQTLTRIRQKLAKGIRQKQRQFFVQKSICQNGHKERSFDIFLRYFILCPSNEIMKHKNPMNLNLFFVLTLIPFMGFAQNYNSYFTGNNTDFVANPSGGICLMGGASEDDNAMKWFLQRANGGDVLVLRASGSNGYNSYLYSDLGINVNSVETIVCNNMMASIEPYIIQKIRQAEAIWFAGGNQWNYINYWRNTAVDSAINEAISQRNIVIGGTSAGMAIMGKYYFSAQNGTITSATALSDPFNSLLRVDSAAFIANTYLNNTITDTHFDSPDRKGRLVTFMARIKQDYGVFANAIACDEYTAVCIDTNGIARVFGGDPAGANQIVA